MVPSRRRRLRLVAVLLVACVTLLLGWQAVFGPEPENDGMTVSVVLALRASCTRIRTARSRLRSAEVRRVLAWVCGAVGVRVPPVRTSGGCNKTVSYRPAERLSDMMDQYAVLFGYNRTFGASALVEEGMWHELRGYFPKISLRPVSETHASRWQSITYRQSKELVGCRLDDRGGTERLYTIVDRPDSSGVAFYQPFADELRREFELSAHLRQSAQEFLRAARGDRPSATFVGLHIGLETVGVDGVGRRGAPLPASFLTDSLDHYRGRYRDALFVVCAEDLPHARRALCAQENVVFADGPSCSQSGRALALLAACNHSIVTVPVAGFWGAYLAGGQVVVPRRRSRGGGPGSDGFPLDVQLAGADNWITVP